MNTNLNSKRLYTIAYLENTFTYSNPALTIENIVENNREEEFIYSIQNKLDDVLDLKIGERLMMNFNRDNDDSTGFIKRIK